ncbi:MAG: HD domain-containing protein [bacterium]|nr:HD domain-containing protein [bacterium]
MIPTEPQSKTLWEKYALPKQKRIHVSLVANVAIFLADQLTVHCKPFAVNRELLRAGALLHDIDKNVPRLPGEIHPDTAVRILREEGMHEVADLVKTHPLHAILDPDIRPKTWEQRLLYLADKMVKYEVITVDMRFALWRHEDLPKHAREILDRSYPLVKNLEQEIFGLLGIKPESLQTRMKGVY